MGNLRDLLTRDSFQQGTLQNPATSRPVRVPLPHGGPVAPASVEHVCYLLGKILAAIELGQNEDGVVGYAELNVITTTDLKLDAPVKQVEIINDDKTQTLQYRIPNSGAVPWVKLYAGESQVIGFQTPRIQTIGFQPFAKTAASSIAVRVVALR